LPEIEVAAGLVFRQGRLLIAQRRAGDHLGGFWEFPGGKRRAEETFTECLRRELREELGIEVEVLELMGAFSHAYPEKIVHLRFHRCRWLGNEPQALGCHAWAWVTQAELDQYRFPPADERLLEQLTRDSAWWEPS